MNEQEWLVTGDAKAMRQYVAGNYSGRKLNLIEIAAKNLFLIDNSQPSDLTYCNIVRDIIGNPWRPVNRIWKKGFGPILMGAVMTYKIRPLAQACYEGVRCDWEGIGTCPKCGLEHGGIFPFEQDGGWSQPPFDPMAMAVLADRLEEAGCTNEDILEHCRGLDLVKECPHCVDQAPDWETNVIECRHCECTGVVSDEDGPYHVRGCWVIDLILGNS